MASFYFPLLFWTPVSNDEVKSGPFTLVPRRWDVSVFDLYSLVAERHPLKMSAELMQIYLPMVSLEIAVEADDHLKAKDLLDTLRVMLYLKGVSPTVAPFSLSHSMNDYAGINSRDSIFLKNRLPEGLREGITAKNSRIEGWPAELTLSILHANDAGLSSGIDEDSFVQATIASADWKQVEEKFGKAAVLRSALARAPLMPDYASSILHIWQAIENVFGKGPEKTYRLSLTLAQLCDPVAPRKETYERAKKCYGERSNITHGTARDIGEAEWLRSWGLLLLVVNAILHRRVIPSENDLFSELLSR